MPKPISPSDFIGTKYFGNIWNFIIKLPEFCAIDFDNTIDFDDYIDSLPVYLLYVCSFYPFYKVNNKIGTSAETIADALWLVLGLNPYEIYDFIALCINRQDGYLEYDFHHHKAWRDEFPLATEIN